MHPKERIENLISELESDKQRTLKEFEEIKKEYINSLNSADYKTLYKVNTNSILLRRFNEKLEQLNEIDTKLKTARYLLGD